MPPLVAPALTKVLARYRDVPGATVISAAFDRDRPHTRWSRSDGTLGREPIVFAYSITKTMIATILFRRVEQGQLSLDDPIGRWFPDVAHGDTIPIWRVLQHSAGIPDYGADPDYHEALRKHPGEPWTFDDYADRSYRRGLDFAPGEGWAYSNPGYMLLRELITILDGRSFAKVFDEEIARPLGLQETRVVEQLEDVPHLAPALSDRLGETPLTVHEHMHPGWVSHGTTISRASEIVRFYEALSGGDLVGPESLARMTDLEWIGRDVAPDVRPSAGLGVLGDPEHPAGFQYGHGAGGPGYNGLAMHFPDFAESGKPLTLCAFRASEADPLAEAVAHETVDVLREALAEVD